MSLHGHISVAFGCCQTAGFKALCHCGNTGLTLSEVNDREDDNSTL